LVVQKYLRNPYLIDGFKFDLRIYVLVTNVQPLRIFMHQEGLARFSSEKFKLKAFNNPFIHLTNYAINKDNANFQVAEDEKGETGHKRSLAAVYRQIEKDSEENNKIDIHKIKSQIKDIIVKTLISIQPDLVHHYRTSQPGDIYNNMCFEILGFDVIIDSKGKPYLLEVNHAPSFNDDTPLDKQVKKNLLIDTFRLLNISIKEKTQVLEVLRQVNEQRIIGLNKGSK
jgi:tubulin polyglutamylase TTLL6/13